MNNLIDFHSHVLPGIDDGSASVEESLQMLRMEKSHGITHVVATPHFYAQHDTPERFLKRRAEAEALLREAMGDRAEYPGISVGAEVYYFRGISNSDVLSQLTVGGNRGILLEMPPSPWTESMYREIEDLYVRRGYLPIIAHIDRYISRFRTFRIPQRLAELPVLVQANAEFFLNRSTSSMALRMLQEDRVHLLGTDCHNLNSRKPNLDRALNLIRKKLGEDALQRIGEYGTDILGNI